MQFTVPGRPIGKGRPRVVNGHAYTPARTREYEDSVATLARNALALANLEPLQGALMVRVWFYLPDHKHEPDIDNLIKCVLDGCNGIIYTDDKQVTTLHAWKNFDKANPRTFVEVSEIFISPNP